MPKPPDRSKPPERWDNAVGELLAQAAMICVEQGLDADEFLRGAWSAYVQARPGLRDYLEELQLRAELDALRESGRIGQA